MPKLYDKDANQWVDVADENVEAYYKSGRFLFPKGTQVNVQLGDGRYGTIDEQFLADVFRNGGGYDTASARSDRQTQREYGDKNIEAGLLGLARGATFNISDALLEFTGAYTEQELAKIEEANPTISAATEMVGAVAPIFMTGGTGALGLAARAMPAGGAAVLASKAGAKVAGAVKLKDQANVADKLVRGGAVLATEAGVEGILFGAGETFSEELLGRTDLTAEQMLTQIGATGAVSGLLGGALGAGPGAVTKAWQAAGNNRFSKAIGEKWAAWSDNFAVAMKNADRETLSRMRDPEFIDDYLNFGEFQKQTSRATVSTVNNLIGDIEASTRSVSGSAKEKLMYDKVTSEHRAETLGSAIEMLQGMKLKYNKMANDVARNDEAKGQLKGLVDELDKEIEAISDLIMKPEKESVRTAFMRLDELKKVIGSYTYRNRKTGKLAFNSEAGMNDAYDDIRQILEDQNLFGEAALIQAQVNPAFSALLKTIPDFMRKFGTKIGGEFEADTNKIGSFVKKIDQIDDEARNKFDIYDRTVKAYKAFNEATESAYGIKQAENALNRQKDLQDGWARMGELIEAKRSMKEMTRNANSFLGMTPTVMGYAVGGFPGAMAARVMQEVTDPASAIQRRMMAHHLKSMASSKIDKIVSRTTNRMVKNQAAKLSKSKGGALPRLLAMFGASVTGDPRQDTKAAISAVHQAANPQVMAAVLEKELAPLHDAPMLKEAVTQKVTNQFAYLASKTPAMGATEIDPVTGEEVMSVSDADLAKFDNVLKTLDDPLTVIGNKLQQGTLSKEEADAWRNNYPELHAELSGRLLGELSNSKKPVSYQDKLMLSKLMGMPLTATLNPGFVGAMQNIHKVMRDAERSRPNTNALRQLANRAILPSDRAMS